MLIHLKKIKGLMLCLLSISLISLFAANDTKVGEERQPEVQDTLQNKEENETPESKNTSENTIVANEPEQSQTFTQKIGAAIQNVATKAQSAIQKAQSGQKTKHSNQSLILQHKNRA